MKTFFLFLALLSVSVLAFADGAMDVTETGNSKSKTALQTLSPKVGKSTMVTLTGNEYQYVDVTNIKMIRIQGVTAAGAATPLEVYFYNSASATDIADPFFIPTLAGAQNFGIGYGVTRVYFRNYSVASPPSGAKVSILAR